MICPKCGEELEDGSTECFLCGYKFGTEDSINDIDEQTELNGNEFSNDDSDAIEDNKSSGLKNNPNKKNTAIVVGILGILIVAVVVVSILSKNNKKKNNNRPNTITELSTDEETEESTEKETETPTDEETEESTEKETETPTSGDDIQYQDVGLEDRIPGEWTNLHTTDDIYAYSMKYVMKFTSGGIVTCEGYISKNSGTYIINNDNNTIEIDFNDCKFWDAGEYHDVKGYKVVMKFDIYSNTFTVLSGNPSDFENWKVTDIWSANY